METRTEDRAGPPEHARKRAGIEVIGMPVRHQSVCRGGGLRDVQDRFARWPENVFQRRDIF
jgi:hypothetical protein